MNIEIVSGSPREHSVTLRAALFFQRHLAEKYPQHNVGLVDLRKYHLPFVNAVYSSPDKAPEELQPLAHRMFAANAFIVVTPEYNGSFSPALANLFDHFPKQLHKAFGLITASVGPLGGMRAALQLQHFALALQGIPSPQMLVVGQVEQKFDGEGNLLAEAFQGNIDTFTSEFIWLAEKLHS
ncbi:NADPH-dependent FMN reductase [Arachidicoccus ginsenosidimutans]|uniref:NADPH-dependent FMN reductase n=1 Tax=Arachidicoccus sp. BS20 TaxID=1850526 RepID=UPI0007F14AF4|nr:NAD(P)H-dependent oxidoreductase [Arachidicoccus sp. BS20]ANI90038.1 NADPH-dependent FMN reductase [Arachidicoccus sp. BS20]